MVNIYKSRWMLELNGPLDISNIWAPTHEELDRDRWEILNFYGDVDLGSTYIITFFKFIGEKGILYGDEMMVCFEDRFKCDALCWYGSLGKG